MSHINVTGASLPPPDGTGTRPPIPPRLNIANLVQNDRLWSLYIQALTLMQNIDHTKDLSWFAISGIHGYPRETQWGNAGPKPTTVGYCAHAAPHFPTWHRPYLAVYEQALQAAALEVAQKYKTDTAAWVKAALTLRAPYWDWADPATYLPPRQVYDSVRYKNVRITTPEGPKDVPNPLLAYTFQRRIDWPYTTPTTVRHPRGNPADSVTAFEDDVRSNAVRGDLQFSCWRTLNWTRTWLEFSNQGATQGQRANSLETLHNWMHVRTGGGGHMSNTISSGFDPIFMLHHTNVDRQLALWQALHPDVWISPQFANRDLTPFWKSANAFHRSADPPVRDFLQFNSTYPEFVGLENLSENEKKARIQAKVDALYDSSNRRRGIVATAAALGAAATALGASVASQAAPQVPVTLAAVRAPGPGASAPAPPVVAAHAAPRAAPAHAAPARAAPRAGPAHAAPPRAPEVLTALQRLDWFIRIRVKKFQLKQSYSILVFLGSVPDNVAQWRSSPHLVGNHAELVNSEPEHCTNCQDNADIITEGFIDLDGSLERMGFGHKSEEEIEKFIRDEIHWRIQKADGTVVPANELEVLEIAVMTWDVTDGDLDILPVHRNLTHEKTGGRVPGRKRYHL